MRIILRVSKFVIKTVTDSKDNLSGYPTGGGLFDYDLNGNMTVQADKGISNIAYNLLDLPSTVTQTNGTIQYLYRADGTKLRKIASGVTTDYVDGFQYEGNDLKFVPTSEGYYNFENNTYIYHYTDHLGNIRLSFTKSGSGAAIIEESNFYPYGMKQENTVQTNSAYNYEQSGKEFQKETGWSDFGARMYMADIGRWGVIDPLAETTRRINPYNYALDNPVSYVDPDGRRAMAIDETWEWAVPLTGSGWFTSGGRNFADFDEFKEKLIKESEKKNQSSGGDGTIGDPRPSTWQRIKNWFKNKFGGKKKTSKVIADEGTWSLEPDNGTRLFGLIKNANVNSNGESPLEQYRAWRNYPLYHEGESWLDRFARNVNATHMDIMLDEGSGGGLMYGGFGRVGNAAGAVAEVEETAINGSFSIADWLHYPSEIPQPTGPFRLLEGAEYDFARKAANLANQTMRKANPELYKGLDIHEIHPVKFGGSPTDPLNKIAIPRDYHRRIVTPWWNNNMRSINKIP